MNFDRFIACLKALSLGLEQGNLRLSYFVTIPKGVYS